LDQAEIGIYEMLGSGLREVSNPSEILISHKDEELSEQRLHPLGMRPLMLEIALVSTAVYGTPQRSTTGYNAKRLNMILALEKELVLGLAPKTYS
jgi:DNA repair protein RadA/Sms